MKRRTIDRVLPSSPRLLRQVVLAELLGPCPAIERRRKLIELARGSSEEASPADSDKAT